MHCGACAYGASAVLHTNARESHNSNRWKKNQARSRIVRVCLAAMCTSAHMRAARCAECSVWTRCRSGAERESAPHGRSERPQTTRTQAVHVAGKVMISRPSFLQPQVLSKFDGSVVSLQQCDPSPPTSFCIRCTTCMQVMASVSSALCVLLSSNV